MHFINNSAVERRHTLKTKVLINRIGTFRLNIINVKMWGKKIKLCLKQDPTSTVGQFLSFLYVIIQLILTKSSLIPV